MRSHAALPALRSRVRTDGLLGLHGLIESAQRDWKEDVLETACERFEPSTCFSVAAGRSAGSHQSKEAQMRTRLARMGASAR